MPRALRIQDAGYVHHVVCKGNDSQKLFNSHEDYETYLTLLNEARSKFSLKVYNFVLMDNHIHLLVEPEEDGGLSKSMEYVSKGYAKYFNKKYERTGHVFGGRFKSFIVQEEKYFFACSRFIDVNPIKWQVVANPEQYDWSGFSYLGYGREGVFKLDRHDIYKNLGENPQERQLVYKAMVNNYQGEELDLLNRRAGILGDREFKRKVKGK